VTGSRITDDARRDIKGIWNFIAADNYDTTDRVYDDRELVVVRVIHGARDIGSMIR